MQELNQAKTETLQELFTTGIFTHGGEQLTYDKNILLDLSLWSHAGTVLADIASLMDQISDHTLKDDDKYRKHLTIVVMNLFVAHVIGNVTWVAYSRDKNNYASKSRDNPLRISHRFLTSVVDRLAEFGFIEHAMGFYDRRDPAKKGKTSKMRSTRKLREVFEAWTENMVTLSPHAETIILRDDDGKAVDYERDTVEVARMRKHLTQLNEVLSKVDIRLDMTSDELADLNEQRKRHRSMPIRYWRKAMHRIFANGSFKQGGRFYRCWWMDIGEGLRKRILIDGEATVEKDYSAIHPTLLYARETGQLPPDKPYEVEGHEGDELVRRVAKKLLLVMINAKRGESVKKAFVWHRDRHENFTDEERSRVAALDLDEITAKLKMRHKPIAKHFSSNVGVKLQYEDAQIAERVMLTLAKQGVVALPIHDSFVVQARHEAALVEAMEQAFQWQCGVVPVIK
ncbi:MAG: hypothetical protein KKA55_08130 [Proteobacteria bacterium]|nr:hypothetical protein [Pseudomonadota bacterium]MBU1595483.1 hypothetical protein [Pseudomonadota bacterium]